jgi:hypothetical protein
MDLQMNEENSNQSNPSDDVHTVFQQLPYRYLQRVYVSSGHWLSGGTEIDQQKCSKGLGRSMLDPLQSLDPSVM